MNIYIGNLDYSVNETELQNIFSEFGSVSSVKIVSDKFTGKSKGYAFVEMPDDSQGSAAVQALNGKAIKDRNITVSEARPKAENKPTNNRYRKN